MQVEIWPLVTRPSLHTSLKEFERDALQKYERLTGNLGLVTHEDLARQSLVRMDRITILSPPLSEIERPIWEAWLPSSYRGRSGFRDYNGDPIPQEVLVALEAWNSDTLFDECEIRINPSYGEAAVFGRRGNVWWLLARWKQSEGPLSPFDDVLRAITDQVSQQVASCRFFATLLFVLGVLGFCGAINLLTLPEPDQGRSFGVFIVSGIALFFATGAWNERKNRLWRALYSLSEDARQRI